MSDLDPIRTATLHFHSLPQQESLKVEMRLLRAGSGIRVCDLDLAVVPWNTEAGSLPRTRCGALLVPLNNTRLQL